MEKCFYCNKNNYSIIKRYGLNICTRCCGWCNDFKSNKCIVCHEKSMFLLDICSKECQTIFNQRRNVQCYVCNKYNVYNYIHHCNIPMKNKYMNVNIN